MATATDVIIDSETRSRVGNLQYCASIAMHPCRQARLQWEVAVECDHILKDGDTRCQRCMSDTLQRDALSYYRFETGRGE